MSREVGASGERHSDGKLTVFTKGREAFVIQGDERLYTNCRTPKGRSAHASLRSLALKRAQPPKQRLSVAPGEYRWHFGESWRPVAFAASGKVGPSQSRLDDTWLPTAGAEVQCRVSKAYA